MATENPASEPACVDPSACWGASHSDHCPVFAPCPITDPCCTGDDCSVECSSVCDGFVACNASTVCSEIHCDEQECQGVAPVCFDKNCISEGHADIDNDICDFLNQDGCFNWNTEHFVPDTNPSTFQSFHTQHNDGSNTFHNMHSINDFFTSETSIGTRNYGYQTHHHGHGCSFDQSAISGPSGSSDPNMNHPLDLCPTLDDCNHQSHFGPVFSDCNPDEFLGFIPMESYPQFHNRYAQLDGIFKLPCDILPDHVHKDLSQISHHSSRPTSSGLDSVHPKSSPFSSPPPKDVTSALTSPELGPIGELHICKCRLNNKTGSTICGASFSDAGQLQDHLIQNHVGTMEGSQGHGYYCSWEGCHRPDEPFSQKSKLQGHFLTHSNHKGFQCSVCRKPFARQATLERHERSHRGEKPYTCKMCQKSFTDSSELKTHMRTHTGEKPFKCNHPGCNFETGDSSNMSSHRLTHGVRKHKCHFPGCTKSFTRPDQLKRHLKTTHKEGTLSPGPLSSPSLEQFPLPQFEPPYRRPSLVAPYQDTAMLLTTK